MIFKWSCLIFLWSQERWHVVTIPLQLGMTHLFFIQIFQIWRDKIKHFRKQKIAHSKLKPSNAFSLPPHIYRPSATAKIHCSFTSWDIKYHEISIYLNVLKKLYLINLSKVFIISQTSSSEFVRIHLHSFFNWAISITSAKTTERNSSNSDWRFCKILDEEWST